MLSKPLESEHARVPGALMALFEGLLLKPSLGTGRSDLLSLTGHEDAAFVARDETDGAS